MNFDDVELARVLLKDFLSPTRLAVAESLSRESGAEVRLKLESEAPTAPSKSEGRSRRCIAAAGRVVWRGW